MWIASALEVGRWNGMALHLHGVRLAWPGQLSLSRGRPWKGQRAQRARCFPKSAPIRPGVCRYALMPLCAAQV